VAIVVDVLGTDEKDGEGNIIAYMDNVHIFLLNDSLLLSPFNGDGRGHWAQTLAGPRRLNRLATRSPMPPLVGHTNIGIVDILCSISNEI
jgi:hypothetical protein